MQRYYVLDREMAAGEDGFEAMVARAYTLKQAVRCLCRRDIALDLYIAHRHGGHVLSRWPGRARGTHHTAIIMRRPII